MKHLKKYYEVWKKIAEKIGNVQAIIIFTIMYFVLIIPIGFLISFFKDFLQRRGKPCWEEVIDNSSTMEKLHLQ